MCLAIWTICHDICFSTVQEAALILEAEEIAKQDPWKYVAAGKSQLPTRQPARGARPPVASRQTSLGRPDMADAMAPVHRVGI